MICAAIRTKWTILWNQHFDEPALMRVVAGLQQQLIEWYLRTYTERPYQERVGGMTFERKDTISV
jgi:hypothetical protein